MSPRSIAFCASFVVVIAVALLVDRLIRPSLQQLLEEITVLPAATEFYRLSHTCRITPPPEPPGMARWCRA